MPFLPSVKLFVSNVPAKSKNLIWSPNCGEAGNVIVQAAADVFTNILSFADAVNVVEPSAVIVDQGLPPPIPVHCTPLYPSQVTKEVLNLKPPVNNPKPDVGLSAVVPVGGTNIPVPILSLCM